MKLFPPKWLQMSEWADTYRVGDELLGYWLCSKDETYLSNEIIGHSAIRAVPVFWIMNKQSDEHPYEFGNFLYFKGCDDHSVGKQFATREEALAWIDACPIVDYVELLKLHYNKGIGLVWFN